MVILLSALGTTAALLVTLRRLLSWRKMAKNAVIIDIVFSVIMLSMFAGTVSGTLIAVFSGLFLALFLSALRWRFGDAPGVVLRLKCMLKKINA